MQPQPQWIAERGLARPTIDVALVIPLHGSAGIFGPSCELCAELAVEQLNAGSGLLAREVRLAVVDGSGPPEKVADEVGALAAAAGASSATTTSGRG